MTRKSKPFAPKDLESPDQIAKLSLGYQQANEYSDDRDYDEHFYQRESALVGSYKRSGWVVFHDVLLSFCSSLSAKSQPGIAR